MGQVVSTVVKAANPFALKALSSYLLSKVSLTVIFYIYLRLDMNN